MASKKHSSLRRPWGQGSIQSRPDSAGKLTYYACHRSLDTGKQVQEPFRKLREAHAYLDQWYVAKRDQERAREAAAEAGETSKPKGPNPKRDWTLSELLADWREIEFSNVRRSTWRNRDAAIACLNKEMGGVKVRDLKPESFEAYVYLALGGYQLGWVADKHPGQDHPRQQPLARSYVRQHLLTARAALERAIALGIRSDNPALPIRLPQPDEKEVPVLKPAELRALIQAMPERHRLPVQLMGELGLRIGETFGLRITDYDPQRKMLTLGQQLAEQGKGQSELTALKTKRARRVLPVSERLQPAIEAQIRYLEGKPNQYGLLCPNRLGGPVSPSNWRRRTFRPACDSVGLPKAVTPHVLRHTAITMWARAQAPHSYSLPEISRRAGHSNSAFTISRYGHISDGEIQIAFDPLAGLD